MSETLAAVAVLAAAALLLSIMAWQVARKKTVSIDARVHDAMEKRRTKALDVAAKPITLLSIPLVIVSATAVLVWLLYKAHHNHAAIAIGITPIVAAVTGQSFTWFFPQRSPPDAAGGKSGKSPDASFPSGHTTGVTAEALAISYILSRENLASFAILAGLFAWPLVVGVTRLYRGRHWFSDVIAGWIAGIGVASLSVIFYRVLTTH
jgi:undecaprenyl-diphosphatase